jgi:hypothetical protein
MSLTFIIGIGTVRFLRIRGADAWLAVRAVDVAKMVRVDVDNARKCGQTQTRAKNIS